MNLRQKRLAGVNIAWLAFLASVAVLVVLVGLLVWDVLARVRAARRSGRCSFTAPPASGRPWRPPPAITRRNTASRCSSSTAARRRCSPTSRPASAATFTCPADDSYLQIARDKGLVRETLPLARMTPVLAVHKGNPKNLHSLDDLERDGVRVGQANPEAAAVGKLTADALKKAGRWAALEKHIVVTKPTVNDVANDVVRRRRGRRLRLGRDGPPDARAGGRRRSPSSPTSTPTSPSAC